MASKISSRTIYKRYFTCKGKCLCCYAMWRMRQKNHPADPNMELTEQIFDTQWVTKILVACAFHLSGIYMFLCCAESSLCAEFEPNIPSTIFIMGIAIASAELCLWPSTLKEPSWPVLTILQILATKVITDTILLVAWFPFISQLSEICQKLNCFLCEYDLACEDIECDDLCNYCVSMIVSGFFFMWMLHATNFCMENGAQRNSPRHYQNNPCGEHADIPFFGQKDNEDGGNEDGGNEARRPEDNANIGNEARRQGTPRGCGKNRNFKRMLVSFFRIAVFGVVVCGLIYMIGF